MKNWLNRTFQQTVNCPIIGHIVPACLLLHFIFHLYSTRDGNAMQIKQTAK